MSRAISVLKREDGFTIVMIVGIAGLLMMMLTAQMAFFRNAVREQSTLIKMGTAAELHGNAQRLLEHHLSCLQTTKDIPLLSVGAELPDPFPIRDATGAAVVVEGSELNGVRVDALRAKVIAVDNGVASIRLRAVYAKLGSSLGKAAYEHFYFLNVATDVTGVIQRCMINENQDELNLVSIQPFEVFTSTSTPPARVLGLFAQSDNAHSFPADWGIQIRKYVPTCMGDACPTVEGPDTSFVAKGNRAVFSMKGGVSVGPSPGYTPTGAAIGARVFMRITDADGNVAGTVLIGTESKSSLDAGFQSGSHISSDKPISIVVGKTYFVRMVVSAIATLDSTYFFAAGSNLTGNLYQYLSTEVAAVSP